MRVRDPDRHTVEFTERRRAIAEKPDGRFMIRSRTRVVKRHPQGDW